MIVYAAVMKYNDRSEAMHTDHLGWVNFIIIFLSDFFLIIWGLLSRGGLYLSAFKLSLFLLVTRLIVCFEPEYWIITHSIVFALLLLLFSTVWIFKNIEVESSKDQIRT